MRRSRQFLLGTIALVSVLSACASAQTFNGASRASRPDPVSIVSAAEPGSTDGGFAIEVLGQAPGGQASGAPKMKSNQLSQASAKEDKPSRKAHASSKEVVVRGGWLNDAPCLVVDPNGTSVDPEGSTMEITCTGTTFWNGGFTGRTVLTVQAHIDANGNVIGTADEWFYGMYLPDKTVGGLHMTHRFSVDGTTRSFYSEAILIGGTCGFAGSRGTGIFIGYQEFGGYTLSWERDPASATAPATCNPLG